MLTNVKTNIQRQVAIVPPKDNIAGPISGIFERNGCRVLSSGTQRNWYYIASLPLRLIISLIKNGYVQGNVFWDLLGFAEYGYMQKRN